MNDESEAPDGQTAYVVSELFGKTFFYISCDVY